MKTLVVCMLVITIASVSNAQFVDIPDTAFLKALIEEGVDTNGDSLISYTEAEAITSLHVDSEWNSNKDGFGYIRLIASLEGVEAFVNLNTLSCAGNKLTSLDVSNNTALTSLNCEDNQFTNLDVSNNPALTVLYCGSNQLTSLDVSRNSALTELGCYSNELTSLDVSDNTALEKLGCSDNQLTSLDISNNTALEYLILRNMSSLYEVCVWEIPFPLVVEPWRIDTSGSPNVYFTTICSITALNKIKENITLDIYPNPSEDIINIEIENPSNAIIEIYNVSGKLVLSKRLNFKAEKIDISDLSEGMYFVKVRQEQNVGIEKLIVY